MSGRGGPKPPGLPSESARAATAMTSPMEAGENGAAEMSSAELPAAATQITPDSTNSLNNASSKTLGRPGAPKLMLTTSMSWKLATRNAAPANSSAMEPAPLASRMRMPQM